MHRQDRKVRNSLRYKISMWFYRLTLQDVKIAAKATFFEAMEIVAIVLSFLLLFVAPAFLH